MSEQWETETCGRCRFWVKVEQVQRGAVEIGAPVPGECREQYHIIALNMPGGVAIQTHFAPVLQGAQACGRFEAA